MRRTFTAVIERDADTRLLVDYVQGVARRPNAASRSTCDTVLSMSASDHEQPDAEPPAESSAGPANAFSNFPWRVCTACALAAAAGACGPLIIDRYHQRSDYIAATILIVAALWAAWRSTRSRIRWDRLLGYPLFVVLALIVVLMVVDRVGRLFTLP